MATPGIKEAFDSALKWIDSHLSFRSFAMLFIMAAVMTFAVNPFLALLELPALPSGYRIASAAIFLLSGAGTLFFMSEGVWEYLRKRWRARKRQEELEEFFSNLPLDQFAVLRRYAESGKSSVKFQASNGAVADLVRRGILYLAVGEGSLLEGFSFTVTPLATPFLEPERFRQLTTGKAAPPPSHWMELD